MTNDRGKRTAGARRRLLIVAVTLTAQLALLAGASTALATPKGIYEVFAQCPTNVPGVTICTHSETTSGEVAIGKTKVPINKPVILQGGAIPANEERSTFFLIPAKNGESLSKTELNVPGGLLDIVNCQEIKGEGFIEKFVRGSCEAIFENKTTGVTATTELVANEHNPALLFPNNLVGEGGTAIVLPVRVHLKNPLLGKSCYIGSESSPLQLHLTTGATSPPKPNESIHGTAGKLSFEAEEFFVLTGASLVDNAFSVPVAEGCGEVFGFTGYLNSIVDGKLGLPSAAGNNTAILSGTTAKLATAEEVIASE